MARGREILATIAALFAVPLPVAAQDLAWEAPAPLVAQIGAERDGEFAAGARALFEDCAAQGYQGSSEHCRALLVEIFAVAHRRDLAASAEWAARRLHDQYYVIERDPDDPAIYLEFAAREMATFDLAMTWPLFEAIGQRRFREDADPLAELVRLDELAAAEFRLGRPPSERLLLEGALELSRRLDGESSDRYRDLASRALRADALMTAPEAVGRCEAIDARLDPVDAYAIHEAVSCAILDAQLGRMREATEDLRSLALETSAAGASAAASADLQFHLGRVLMLQERWPDAEAPLRAALDLLRPEGMGADYFQDRGASQPAKRAADFLKLALELQGKEGIRTSNSYGGIDRRLGLFYGIEELRWSAQDWAAKAERLQEKIDSGALQWEGGVWRSLRSRYNRAKADIGQLRGREDPLFGYYAVKDAEAGELSLTEGYRREHDPAYIDRFITPEFEKGARLIAAGMAPTQLEYADGLHAAAIHWAREDRDPGRAYGLCSLAMGGVRESVAAEREFDAVAQRRLKQAAPIFADCIGVMWNARAFDDTAAQDAR